MSEPFKPKRFRRGGLLKRVPSPVVVKEYTEKDFATKEKPIGICPDCFHHTSAFAGRCTALVLDENDIPRMCNHDCLDAHADFLKIMRKND